MIDNGQKFSTKRIKKILDKIETYDVFLKLMYGKQDNFKEALFNAFSGNEFVIKYQKEHDNNNATEEVKEKPVSKLTPSEIIKKNRGIHELLSKSPLIAPFLDWVGSKEYKEPRLGLFDKNPSRSVEVIEDIKVLYAAMQKNIQPKDLNHGKQKVRQMFDDLYGKRKSDAKLADLKTLLALHSWSSLRDQASLTGQRTVLLDTLKHFCQAMFLGGFNYFNVTGFVQAFLLYIHNYFMQLKIEAEDIDKNIALASSESEINRHMEGLEGILRKAYYISPTVFNNPRNSSIERVMLLAKDFESKQMGFFANYSMDLKLKNLYLKHMLKAIQNVVNSKPKRIVNEIHSEIYVNLYLTLLSYVTIAPNLDLGQKLINKLNSSDYEINLRLRLANSKYYTFSFFTSFWLDKNPELEVQGTTNIPRSVQKRSRRGGSAQSTRKHLDTLIKYCYETIDLIKSNMKDNPLKKAYEHDPFIKAYSALINYKDRYINDIKVITVYHKFMLQVRYLIRGVALYEKKPIHKNARRMLTEITSSMNKYKKENSKN